MFFDKDKIRKVDLGNKKVLSKDQFLKKIKDDKTKDVEKNKIAESHKIIASFLARNSKRIYRGEVNVNSLTKNLKSILALLKMKKDFDENQKEKVAVIGVQKTLNSLQNVYNSFNLCLTISPLNELTKIFLEVLKYFKIENLRTFVSSNLNLFKNILVISLKEYYINTKRDYLIDEKMTFFIIYQFFTFNNLEDLIYPIYSAISNKISILYLLQNIVKSMHKILNDFSRSLMLKFILSLEGYIVNRRSRLRVKGEKYSRYKYTHRIVENLLEVSIGAYLDHHKLLPKAYLYIDLFEFYNSTVEKGFLIFLNEEKLVKIVTDMSKTLEIPEKRKKHVDMFTEYEIELFNCLFPIFAHKIQNSTIFNKLNVDKKGVLKGVNDILELVMECYEKAGKNEKNDSSKTSVFISLIYNSARLIEVLYNTNYEKSDFQSILDYVINKTAEKYSKNSKIIEDILLYAVEITKEFSLSNRKNLNLSNVSNISSSNTNNNLMTTTTSTPSYSEEVLEVVSFVILNKIEYKENYFFVEFRNSNDIYQNLPFNFLFLNLFSKLLIQVFIQLISRTNFDEIEKLNQNMIIKCLKGLYMLDADIEFSPNRDTFWMNMEVISKFSGYSQTKQLESMKIMPFVFPFTYRLTVLNTFFKNLKKSRLNMFISEYDEDPRGLEVNLTISREHMFDETLNLYLNNKLVPFLRWKVTFIDKFGNREEGVDAGGLYKEYLYKLSEQAFSMQTEFFIESISGFLMPNPNSAKVSHMHLQIFEFLGFIIGIGLIDDIKLWPNFSLFFLNNILEVENPFTELKSYDPDLYKNLVNLKNYEGDVENDFGLNFTLNEERDNLMLTTELIPNGKNVNVTNNNKLLYINKVAQYKLYHQIRDQCEAFRRGLMKVCDDDVLKVFTADEFRQLIFGFDKEVMDIADLKMNTEYEHGWDFTRKTDRDTLQYFWEILEEFDNKEREKFLFFVTSLKRPPLGGFKKLLPKFKLAKSSKEVPTASTCTNMLLLPVLPKNKMREVLRYVINADSGFYYG